MRKLKSALLPIITGGIFLLLYLWIVYQTPINRIFAPNTTWDDDVIYYKQLSAVITHGYPKGFFGYNESHAYIGSFGAWGPVLFYIYALPALIIGTCPNMMLFCNVFFVLIGWSILVNCTKMSWKQQILIAFMICFLQLPVRYILSGMSEALWYAFIMAAIGLSYAEIHEHRPYKLVCLLLLSAIYTLIRPYGIVFGILPVMLLIIRKNYKAAAASCFAGTGIFILSVFFMQKLSAPYLYSSISNEGLQMIASGEIIKGCVSCFYLFVHSMQETISYIVNDWKQGEGLAGIIYADVLLLIIILSACLIRDRRRKQNIYLKTGILSATLLIFLIISFFYAIYQGSRHMLILCIGIAIVLALENQKACIFAAAGMFLVFMGIKWEEPEYPLRYEEAMARSLEEYSVLFAEHLSLQNDTGTESFHPSWDHTIAFDMDLDFRWIYCITDGMGIQYDEASYLENPNNEIKSKYIMTYPKGNVYNRLISDHYDEIIKTDDFVVLEHIP